MCQEREAILQRVAFIFWHPIFFLIICDSIMNTAIHTFLISCPYYHCVYPRLIIFKSMFPFQYVANKQFHDKSNKQA